MSTTTTNCVRCSIPGQRCIEAELAGRRCEVPVAEVAEPDWAAISARYEAEYAAAWDLMVAAKGLTSFPTGSGVDVIRVAASWPAGVDEEGVLSGAVAPTEIVVTSDGGQYRRDGWHDGESDIDSWVYFERWERELGTSRGYRVAHGYIDPVSRRLVQAG